MPEYKECRTCGITRNVSLALKCPMCEFKGRKPPPRRRVRKRPSSRV